MSNFLLKVYFGLAVTFCNDSQIMYARRLFIYFFTASLGTWVFSFFTKSVGWLIAFWFASFVLAWGKCATEYEKKGRTKAKYSKKSDKNTGWTGRDFVLAGLNHEGREKFVTDNMDEIDEVFLIREPKNRHDKSAIAVVWNDKIIGYIPAGSAEIIAPAMDSGLSLTAHARVWRGQDKNVVRVYLTLSSQDEKALSKLLAKIDKSTDI